MPRGNENIRPLALTPRSLADIDIMHNNRLDERRLIADRIMKYQNHQYFDWKSSYICIAPMTFA